MISDLELPLIGVREIDVQHAQLRAWLDRLQTLIGAEEGSAEVSDTVQMLQDNFLAHFAFEERFLRSQDYPSLDAHIEEHRLISDRIAALKAYVLDGSAITHAIVAMVRQWLTLHVWIEDSSYADYLQKLPE